MNTISFEIDALRDYLDESAKRCAKKLSKATGKKHSECLDQVATCTGWPRWSLLSKALKNAVPDQILVFAALLCPEFRRMGIPDYGKAAEVMRDWVQSRYTPLVDFAFYDSETEHGYAWPAIDIEDELVDGFNGIFAESLIREVALELEEDGPWGIEDYGRGPEDD